MQRSFSFLRMLAAMSAASFATSIMVQSLSAPAAFLDRGAAPRKYARRTSRYMPYQGERECARRRRQIAAGQIKA